jgi:hypothetical protein
VLSARLPHLNPRKTASTHIYEGKDTDFRHWDYYDIFLEVRKFSVVYQIFTHSCTSFCFQPFDGFGGKAESATFPAAVKSCLAVVGTFFGPVSLAECKGGNASNEALTHAKHHPEYE